MGKYIRKHIVISDNNCDTERMLAEQGINKVYLAKKINGQGSTIILEYHEFIQYCKDHSINELFNISNSVYMEDLLITNAMIEEVCEGGEDTIKFLVSFADEWNAEIQSLQNMGIYEWKINEYFVILDNYIVRSEIGENPIKGYALSLDCLDRDALTEKEFTGKEILNAFIDKHIDAYLGTISEEVDADSLFDELRKEVLHDKRFLGSTNKALREMYAFDLWKKKSFRYKYEKQIRSPYILISELDRIYGDYKRECAIKNIRVGEPLEDV